MNKTSHFFIIIISIILICLIPFYRFYFLDINYDYSDYLIYDDISFENVAFYLTKSLALINSKSFFCVDDISEKTIVLHHDIIPNIICALFINIFQSNFKIALTLFYF